MLVCYGLDCSSGATIGWIAPIPWLFLWFPQCVKVSPVKKFQQNRLAQISAQTFMGPKGSCCLWRFLTLCLVPTKHSYFAVCMKCLHGRGLPWNSDRRIPYVPIWIRSYFVWPNFSFSVKLNPSLISKFEQKHIILLRGSESLKQSIWGRDRDLNRQEVINW